MSTNDDKKYRVTNWFSSLRRQPKPKKHASKSQLQKSCLDLTAGSTNASSLPASVANSPKLKRHDANVLLTTKSSNTAPNQMPSTSATERMPNLVNEKLNQLTRNAHNHISNNSSSDASSVKSGDSSESSHSLTIHSSGKTVTTITRKITKITVIKNNEQNFRRAGLIFDDNGKLISESIAYQNFTQKFRSNLIGNDQSHTPIKNGSTIRTAACDNIQTARGARGDDSNASTSTVMPPQPPSPSTLPTSPSGNLHQVHVVVGAKSIDGGQENSENSSCSLSDRLITSKELDDEIEFIDSSSSMSDICSVGNCATDDSNYFNTLPKQPKTHPSIKQQKIEPKLSGGIRIQQKVDKLQPFNSIIISLSKSKSRNIKLINQSTRFGSSRFYSKSKMNCAKSLLK